MNIEEKARRYDKALERAKNTIEVNQAIPDIVECVKSLFPELEESGDEEIRKALIKLVKKAGEGYENVIDGVSIENAISWLEKQSTDISSFPKEQQMFMKKYVSLDKITLIKLLAERDANNAEIIESFEKLGEQKPVPKFKIGDTMRTLQEAKDEWTDGMPIVVSIDNEYYHCTNELIAIKDQDEYEYPPMNRKYDICDSCDEQKFFSKYKVGDTIYYNSFGRLVSFVIANIVEDGTDNPMYEDKDGNSVFQNDIVEKKVESKFKVGDWSESDRKQFEKEMWDKCYSYIHDLME